MMTLCTDDCARHQEAYLPSCLDDACERSETRSQGNDCKWPDVVCVLTFHFADGTRHRLVAAANHDLGVVFEQKSDFNLALHFYQVYSREWASLSCCLSLPLNKKTLDISTLVSGVFSRAVISFDFVSLPSQIETLYVAAFLRVCLRKEPHFHCVSLPSNDGNHKRVALSSGVLSRDVISLCVSSFLLTELFCVCLFCPSTRYMMALYSTSGVFLRVVLFFFMYFSSSHIKSHHSAAIF